MYYLPNLFRMKQIKIIKKKPTPPTKLDWSVKPFDYKTRKLSLFSRMALLLGRHRKG